MIDERNIYILLVILAGAVLWTYIAGIIDARRVPPNVDHSILFLPYNAFGYGIGCIPDHVKSPEVHPFISLLNDRAKAGWELVYMDRSTQMLVFRKVGPTGILTHEGKPFNL